VGRDLFEVISLHLVWAEHPAANMFALNISSSRESSGCCRYQLPLVSLANRSRVLPIFSFWRAK
jgi:hypothetical protein